MYPQPPTGIPALNLTPEQTRDPKWGSGLCDCCTDMDSCTLTCMCPCIAFGRIAEILDEGNPSCMASGALYTAMMMLLVSPHLYSCGYRGKMRHQYGLPPDMCGDCMVHCLCECCALCQEYRELQRRGYNLSLGWHGNMERRNREGVGVAVGMTMTPPPVVHERMSK